MDLEPQVIHGRIGGSPALVDRLDPVLGEASSGIGAMLTKLIRRTLRGGIQRVDEELDGVVSEKVDGAVAQRLPAIEAAATQTAEHAASIVAAREVALLDERTTEVTRRLAGDLAETGLRLESTARELVSDLEHRSNVATQSLVTAEVNSLQERTDQRINVEISSLESRTSQLVEHEIESVEQRATSAAQTLVSRGVEEVEQRAAEKAQTLINTEVAELLERSRSATQTLHKHINALHEAHTELKGHVSREQSERRETVASVETELRSQIEVITAEFRATLERSTNEWRRRWEDAESARSHLAERLAELERPRGLRALAAKFFGKKPAAREESDPAGLAAADIEEAEAIEA